VGQARVIHPVTIVVAKDGDSCWLGHLDFARAVERALRRSGLPLTFTEGFHKRAKLRLPEPLPLGVGSDGERFVVPLAEPRTAEQVLAALSIPWPRGVAIRAVIAGSCPERLDAPVELELRATGPQLAAALAALPVEVPAIGGSWRRLGSAVDAAPGTQATALVRLEPRPGTRVSIGRFLESLQQAAGGELALERVHRRVAWQAEVAPLPSSAPLPEPGESSAGASPCTP
jgi:hypothetical protein